MQKKKRFFSLLNSMLFKKETEISMPTWLKFKFFILSQKNLTR